MKHAQLFVLALAGLALAAVLFLQLAPAASERNDHPESQPETRLVEPEPAAAAPAPHHTVRRRETPSASPEDANRSPDDDDATTSATETRPGTDRPDSRPLDPIAAAAAAGLPPICSVTGKVTDEAGTPVKAARVRAIAQNRQRTAEEPPVQTDEHGAFTVPVFEPGPHELEVDAEGYLRLVTPGPDCVLGVVADAGTLVVRNGLAVRGIVLGPNDEPLARRRVEAMSTDGARRGVVARAVTGTDGTFELGGLRPESYRVACTSRADAVFSMAPPVWVDVRPPAENLVLRVEEHHLEVDVVDRVTEKPLPRCEIRLVRRIGADENDQGASRRGELFVARIEPGVEYRVLARAPGYRTPAVQRVTLAREEAMRRIVFALEKEDPDNIAELTITGEGGEPIPRARLEVFRKDGDDTTFIGHVDRMDPKGVHRTDPLEPGRYRIRVEARKGAAERDCHFAASVDVQIGNGIARHGVPLTKGGLFVVHVKDQEGSYLGGVSARLSDSGGTALPMDYCVLTRNSTSCSSDEIPQAGAAVPRDAVRPGEYSLELTLPRLAPEVVRFRVAYDQVTPVEAVLKPAK